MVVIKTDGRREGRSNPASGCNRFHRPPNSGRSLPIRLRALPTRVANRAIGVAVVVASLASAAAGTPDPWTDPTRVEFEYRVDVSALRVGSDQVLRVWVPYPMENADQKLLSANVSAPWPYAIREDERGNRSVFLEGHGAPEQPLVLRFLVERQPSSGVPPALARSSSADDPALFLKPAKLIPLDGVIRRLAEKESRGRETDGAKVRAFYDYVVKNMRYNKDGDGWGRGDAVWACDHKRGNCTDFHSLFIGMARSQGIPARFVMGVPIPQDEDGGRIPGYHCWSQYYEEQKGWVPLDASEAHKSGRADDYFGQLPSDRIEFTVGRDLTLTPPQAGPPLNYFIYPYAEAGGQPLEVPFTFLFRRVSAPAS